MASGGWVAELDKKEHKNWVMVGCALNIAKKGITSKIQNKMETWYSVHYFQSTASVTSLLRMRTFSTKVRHLRHLGKTTETSPQVRETKDVLGQQ